jgi:CubicO group peptidase (beta-lactamase class C family)
MTHTPLPRATPESQGVDSAAVEALIREATARDLGFHSLMVLRHGNVIAEGWWAPYSAPQQHMMFSVSKSFTASAIGIAEAEGRLSVDDEVLSFFPSHATDAIRANMAGVRVRDLLAMASGHAVDTIDVMRALPGHDWVKLFLEVPIVYPPGTHFLYNTGATFVLAAIIQSRTGQSVLDYLAPRVFEPLGIELPPWEKSPSGIPMGGTGLRLRTEDLAKLGQLYLQRGLWNGQRILSEDWVSRASSVQVANDGRPVDWTQGYGYQFWRGRHGSYRADGAYGQFSLILPELDLVVAITEGASDTQATLDAVWELLLPGIRDSALPENPEATAALSQTIAGLELPVPSFVAAAAAREAALSGRTIELPFNLLGVDSASLRFDAGSVILSTVARDGHTEAIAAGRDSWQAGSTTAWKQAELTDAALESKAGWVDENTLELHQQCVETPFRRVWRFVFGEESRVTVRIEYRPERNDAETLEARIR